MRQRRNSRSLPDGRTICVSCGGRRTTEAAEDACGTCGGSGLVATVEHVQVSHVRVVGEAGNA